MAEVLAGFVQPALALEQNAEMVAGRRIARVGRQRLPETCLGLVGPGRPGKQVAQVALGLDMAGSERDRPGDEVHRPRRVAGAMGEQPEQMERIGVFGVGAEDFAIDRPGLVEAPSALRRDARREPWPGFAGVRGGHLPGGSLPPVHDGDPSTGPGGLPIRPGRRSVRATVRPCGKIRTKKGAGRSRP